MDYFPIRRAARRREFEVMNAGQTPTDRWWPDAAGVGSAPLSIR
jgi:hypothetical protein